jgi:hypothetical protein
MIWFDSNFEFNKIWECSVLADPDWAKMLDQDPDPYEINPDPQQWLIERISMQIF